MAKADRMEIAIFPIEMVSAMIRLLNIIHATGGVPEVDTPWPSMWA